MKINPFIHNLTCLVLILFITGACTKTEILPLEEQVKNRILEYKIVNDNVPLFGAIDHDNNTITVYRPYYSGIDLLIPEIKLEAGTILVDKDGKEINLDGGLSPVPVDTAGFQYRILGNDDKIRTYSLFIKTQVYPTPLQVGYSLVGSDIVNDTKEYEMVVGGSILLYGNFESTSTKSTFEIKHRASGKTVNDLLSVNVIKISNGNYVATLRTDIKADTGYYDIKMHHQGRTAQLPPLRLVFRKPGMLTHTSNADWEKAPGEIITLKGYTANTAYVYNATLVGLKRAYMKIVWDKTKYAEFPEGFPESLLDTPIEIDIVSYTRDELKIRMPNLPPGKYVGQADAGGSSTLGHRVRSTTFGIYLDYEDWTGWGKDNLTGYSREMVVLKK
ncbi:hypothetical protein [Sphingobacterium faecale]|uniref:Uncharacterized protein n=1 Tax=Sphingobacterium faecale TaxID=2803775 RepID=A0ABS1QXU2_9SPHI|nr:hypothetical protein [Sphingobacterium faecale]MBL1407251.1 hypothetical protein [Sphingobacterium faecale]